MVKFKLNDDIINFAKFAESKGKILFLVGGFVRDSIIGIKSLDIDSTGSISIEEVQEFCDLFNCILKIKNKKLQVAKIIFPSGFSLEYARMRVEHYKDKFSHTPEKISFTDRIEEDYKRRDFTINALYLGPLTLEIYDFVGGMSDIIQGILRDITVDGRSSLCFDPERILRGIELSLRLNFKIDDNTLNLLISNFENVEKLSSARRNECLAKINSHSIERLDKTLKEKLKKLEEVSN